MPPRLAIALVLALLLSPAAPAPARDATARVETFTYKKAGDLEIKLDAHRPSDEKIRPLVVWIHGGALINGGRQGLGRASRRLLDEGYCVVSIDYRLAPETKLPEIISDLEDAFGWLRAHAREKFSADASKIAVMGGSAGGHLTLSSGFRVRPRPVCLVSFWGYGDLIGPWLSQPSPHTRHQAKTLTEDQIVAIEKGPPVANAADRVHDGGAYYQHARHTGTWPRRVSGFDPEKNPESFDPYMAAANVSPDYPPTLLIHGTEDTDVPHEQSEIMAREFKKHGVPFRFISVKGGEHGLRGGGQEDVDEAFAAVLPFMRKYLGAAPE